jgi:hypothetical protein
MTKQHKATPEQWSYAETCAPEDFAGYACILELRGRIEALEAAQQPPQDKLDRLIALDRDDPAGSLVERVVGIIGLDPVGDGKARAAIREVAAWLRAEMIAQGVITYGLDWATRLQQEANQ